MHGNLVNLSGKRFWRSLCYSCKSSKSHMFRLVKHLVLWQQAWPLPGRCGGVFAASVLGEGDCKRDQTVDQLSAAQLQPNDRGEINALVPGLAFLRAALKGATWSPTGADEIEINDRTT